MAARHDVEREALAVVDRYLAALNARDSVAIRDAFNFPHTRVGASGNLALYERPEDYRFEHFYAHTGPDGWDHTEWDHTAVVYATEAKAHVAVNFSRYRADDTLIRRYFSLYIVTCRDGHWGIQIGSGDGS